MIGMTAQLISKHRNGKLVTLDDKYAYALEKALELPHGTIIADQHAEREKDPAMRAVWQRLGKLVTAAGNGVAAGVMAITFWGLTFAPNSAQANENLFKNQLHNYTLCAIMTSTARHDRTTSAKLFWHRRIVEYPRAPLVYRIRCDDRAINFAQPATLPIVC